MHMVLTALKKKVLLLLLLPLLLLLLLPGKIVIIGKSVDSIDEARRHSINDDAIAGINTTTNSSDEVPWQNGWFHDRMEITKFKFVMTPTSPRG